VGQYIEKQRCRSCQCQGSVARLVSDRELRSPEFLRDVRNFTASLGIPKGRLLDAIMEAGARSEARFIDHHKRPVALSFESLLPADDLIDAGLGGAFEDKIKNWMEETFAVPVPDHVTPHVRVEARKRFRVIATILRAAYPQDAMMWGVRPANDNSAAYPPEHLKA